MTAQDKRPLSFDLVESLKGKIEHFCADGGLDEQVCSELLQQEFPALKVRVRDATHATRRIPSRATASDDYLASTLRMFITSKNSPAQMIQFRSYFAVKFEKFVHETKGWKCAGLAGLGHLCWLRTFCWLSYRTNMFNLSLLGFLISGKNLRAAKHRFESIQKPTGRIVTWHWISVHKQEFTWQIQTQQNYVIVTGGCSSNYQKLLVIWGAALRTNLADYGAHGPRAYLESTLDLLSESFQWIMITSVQSKQRLELVKMGEVIINFPTCDPSKCSIGNLDISINSAPGCLNHRQKKSGSWLPGKPIRHGTGPAAWLKLIWWGFKLSWTLSDSAGVQTWNCFLVGLPHDNLLHLAPALWLRTLALLADAHDEAFLLTRICDEEGFKPSELMTAIKRYLDQVMFLLACHCPQSQKHNSYLDQRIII